MTENNSHNDENMSRREFIARSAKAGFSIAAAAALGAFFYDPKGPTGRDEANIVRLSNYAIRDLNPRMAIVSGADRFQTVRRGVKAVGGMETFVKKGDTVLIKVNAAFASPPSLCATTHPDVVRETVKMCLEAGASEVRVTDNPINDPASCFRLSGIQAATEESGGKLYFPKEGYFRETTVKGGSLITRWPLLYEPFKGVDKLIGITPVKDHHRSGASMTLKNWYGLLGGRRNIFHQDIHNIIKELGMMATPSLVILDGTQTMMTNGPTGGSLSDLKETNVMIVSTDPVAADAFGATLLEKTPSDLPFILKAADKDVGTADWEGLGPERISV